MSIATAITNLQGKIANAYTAIQEKGGTLPQVQNAANLSATIADIPSGGGGSKWGMTLDEVFSVISNGSVVDGSLVLFRGVSGDVNFTGVKRLWSIYPMYRTFLDSNLRSVSFPDLAVVENDTFNGTFDSCTNLSSVSFPKLSAITGPGGFKNTFKSCTKLSSISFPMLTTCNSTGLSNNVFSGCTNLTEIHFRADSQSMVEGLSYYSSKWGAPNANCQVYFDL